jgi:ribonucleoside-diphosphate reductase alpha chain
LKKIKYQGIVIDKEDPAYITEFSKTLLDGFYKREDETIPQALSRPATAFCYGDYELAQRIYDYAYKGWFMYASPVLSNATRGKWFEDHEKVGKHYWYTSTFVPEEKRRGLPISCFAFDVPDTAQGQVEAIQELATLSMSGGGTGAHLSIRGVGGKAVGNIPYQKVMDSAIGYFKQENRRGAIAAYLDVSHPDIVEHINFRKPGGDAKRRSDNRQQYHSAVNITDKFIDAVKDNTEYDLVCPHTGRVHDTLRAREVWENILETRALTGEPYLLKIDEANRRMPETQKAKGLKIRGSNLC